MPRWFNHFIPRIHLRTSGGSILSKQGADDSEITFFVRPLHIKFQFLHPYTLKICLKMHVGVLKYLTFSYINTCFNTSLTHLFFNRGPIPHPLKLLMPSTLIDFALFVFIDLFSCLVYC